MGIEKNGEWLEPLKRFAEGRDRAKTFLALDLDGTALLEDQGKVFISSSVEKGVKALHDLKVPIILNTLRFPLSVIRTVGQAWYHITDTPILTVLLNGSVLGYIKCVGKDLRYEEIAAFPLSKAELDEILSGLNQLLKAGIEDVLLFYYSRDWKEGEALWTPDPDKVPALEKKFVSASRISSGSVDSLAQGLFSREICMVTLFIDRPEDSLMAYQHTRRSNFFTAHGVNKASGLRAVAERLNLAPADALGAGDTEMDSFLAEVGFAVIVGKSRVSFQGVHETIRVPSPQELGELMLSYAGLIHSRTVL